MRYGLTFEWIESPGKNMNEIISSNFIKTISCDLKAKYVLA